MRFGLIAHRLHRQGTDCGLLRWLRVAEPVVNGLQLGLHAVGGTFDAVERYGLLDAFPTLVRYPNGFEGGLTRLVSHIVGGVHPSQALDGIVFLIDPTDPSSLFPEAQALKRQCVIHGKPFLATEAAAQEWLEIEGLHAGLASAPAAKAALLQAMPQQVVALIAHDALKTQMVEFASTHFDLLSRFQERVATGTTGGLLNTMAWSRGWPQGQPWVTPYRSGPLGGDAQIAERVLDGTCQKVIFFEDPHVARQHEADIQLMERAVCSASTRTTCMNSPAMAWRWAEALKA